jgi:molecular chaperone GrpE (heat shock protein)
MNIKKSFQTNIRFSIEEMKKNREFETWVEGLVGSRFDEVIQKLNEECETVLKDTENTINGIRGEMAEYKANGEAAKRKLDEAKERCLEIIKDLEPVYEQVHAALKSMENEQGA